MHHELPNHLPMDHPCTHQAIGQKFGTPGGVLTLHAGAGAGDGSDHGQGLGQGQGVILNTPGLGLMSPLPCVSPIPTTNTTTHGTHPRNHGNNGAGASTTMSSSSSSGDQLLCLPLQQRDVLNLPLFIASTLCYCYHKPHFVVSTYSHILSSHLALIISSRPYHLISPLSSHLTLAPISSSSSPVANAGRGGFDDELSALLGRTEVRQGCTIRVFCCGVVVVNILPVELPPPPPF